MAVGEIFQQLQDAATSGTRTCLPGEVTEYEHSEQKASVQPAVDFQYIDPETEEIVFETPPVVPNCPVAFPSAAGFSFTFPLSPGDPVVLVFSERSTDEWLSQGGTGHEPADSRRFDLSDAIVVPGGRPFGDAVQEVADNAAVLASDKEIHFGKADPSDWIALASKVKDTVNALISDVKSFVSTYNSHQHQQVMPLIPASPGPTPGTASASGFKATKPSDTSESDYKSSKVKSE